MRSLHGALNGVCCDRDDSIHVAVSQYITSSGDIQRFSPDGKYIECVIKDCSDPFGITFTPGGDLVVAARRICSNLSPCVKAKKQTQK